MIQTIKTTMLCAALCAAVMPIDGTMHDVFPCYKTFEQLPYDMSNLIAKHMLAARPELNQLNIYKKINIGGQSSAIVFSPDGAMLATNKTPNDTVAVVVLDAGTGQTLQTLQTNGYAVESMAFSPDGTSLACGTTGGFIAIWDTRAWRQPHQTCQQPHVLRGHTRAVDAVAWNHDGTQLASGSIDKNTIIWDTKTWKQLHTLQSNAEVNSVAFSPDGTKLASGSDDDKTIIWDTNTGKQLYALQSNDDLTSVAWNHAGTQLASGLDGGKIIIWDANTGHQLKKLRSGTDFGFSIAWSHDDTQLAFGADNEIIIWDAKTWQKLRTLRGHTDSVRAIAFSPNGTQLASGSNDKTIIIWNFAPLLSAHDQENITLEQVLFLMFLQTKRPTIGHARGPEESKPIDFNRQLHDKLLIGEAQAVLDSFDSVSKANIIKRYRIIEYRAPVRKAAGKTSAAKRRHAVP